MGHNRAQFVEMARPKVGDQSRLLLKAVGKLKHGGEDVAQAGLGGLPGACGFRWVRRVNTPPTAELLRENAEGPEGAAVFRGDRDAR